VNKEKRKGGGGSVFSFSYGKGRGEDVVERWGGKVFASVSLIWRGGKKNEGRDRLETAESVPRGRRGCEIFREEKRISFLVPELQKKRDSRFS